MSTDMAMAVQMARATAEALIAATNELCALDCVAGDGDHGFAMAAASKGILAQLDSRPPADVRQLFAIVGSEFSKVGGSMGALIFVAADAVSATIGATESMHGANVAAALLTSAQNAITEFGGAKPGDKTLVDALDAARAACEDASPDEPTAQTLRRASDAAKAGAAATAKMTAKVGRASRLGEIGRGSADAGATSFAVCMEALASTCMNWRKKA